MKNRGNMSASPWLLGTIVCIFSFHCAHRQVIHFVPTSPTRSGCHSASWRVSCCFWDLSVDDSFKSHKLGTTRLECRSSSGDGAVPVSDSVGVERSRGSPRFGGELRVYNADGIHASSGWLLAILVLQVIYSLVLVQVSPPGSDI